MHVCYVDVVSDISLTIVTIFTLYLSQFTLSLALMHTKPSSSLNRVRLPIVEVNVTMIRTTPSLVVQMMQQEVMNESLSEGWDTISASFRFQLRLCLDTLHGIHPTCIEID